MRSKMMATVAGALLLSTTAVACGGSGDKESLVIKKPRTENTSRSSQTSIDLDDIDIDDIDIDDIDDIDIDDIFKGNGDPEEFVLSYLVGILQMASGGTADEACLRKEITKSGILDDDGDIDDDLDPSWIFSIINKCK